MSSNEQVEAISQQWLANNPDLDSFVSTWTMVAIAVGVIGAAMLLYSELNTCFVYRWVTECSNCVRFFLCQACVCVCVCVGRGILVHVYVMRSDAYVLACSAYCCGNVHTYAQMYVRMYAYKRAHAHTHAWARAHTQTYTHTHTSGLHMCVYTYACIHMHVYIHAHGTYITCSGHS